MIFSRALSWGWKIMWNLSSGHLGILSNCRYRSLSPAKVNESIRLISDCRSFLLWPVWGCAANRRRLVSIRRERHRTRKEVPYYRPFSFLRSRYCGSIRARSSWRAVWSSAAPTIRRIGPRELDTCHRCRNLWRFSWYRVRIWFSDASLLFLGTPRFPCRLHIIFSRPRGLSSWEALKYNWSIL